MALRDWLFHSERVATGVCSPPCPGVAEVATVAVATPRKSKTDGAYEAVTALENANTAGKPTPATAILTDSKPVATARDSKTGEVVPRRLAVAEPAPDDEFQARRSCDPAGSK
jgi:hypothetical protein